jgi:hypothetical protein
VRIYVAMNIGHFIPGGFLQEPQKRLYRGSILKVIPPVSFETKDTFLPAHWRSLSKKVNIAIQEAYAFAAIFSIPPMYGRRAFGTVTLPSAFW